MNSTVCRSVTAVLFCFAWITGATAGSAVAKPHPMEQRSLEASGGMPVERAAADDGQEPSEDDPAGDLENELHALIEELKKLERSARDVFNKEVLPRIRKEIQRLREKLREFDLEHEGEQPEPRET